MYQVKIDAETNAIIVTDANNVISHQFDLEEWKQELSFQLAKFDIAIDTLIKPPFQIEEIVNFIYAIITTAEVIVTGDKMGLLKKQIVLAIWEYYDAQYQLIEKIDQEIDLKQTFGSFIGGILETVDGPVFKFLIENFIIPILVRLLLNEKVLGNLQQKIECDNQDMEEEDDWEDEEDDWEDEEDDWEDEEDTDEI